MTNSDSSSKTKKAKPSLLEQISDQKQALRQAETKEEALIKAEGQIQNAYESNLGILRDLEQSASTAYDYQAVEMALAHHKSTYESLFEFILTEKKQSTQEQDDLHKQLTSLERQRHEEERNGTPDGQNGSSQQ